MKSLFSLPVKSEIVTRIEKLRPDTNPVWGKMNSAQMLAHANVALEYACGDRAGKQHWMGKLIGGFMKKGFYNEKPFSKNGPTAPQFIISDERIFENEKQKLIATVERFYEGGPGNATKSPHMFFGTMLPDQWGVGMYKHMDHHLTQFGI